MLNADFRLQAAGGFEPSAPRGNGAAADFGSLYRQLDGEVRRFIEQGSPAESLNAEAQWHRAQMPEAAEPAPLDDARQAFLEQITPLAESAGEQLGVAPEVLAAHAALESGWGRQPVRRSDGSDSHNLFGIKASGAWRGEVARSSTTEYEQGQAKARVENFRAYAGPAQSFEDLTQLLTQNPRYRAALGTGSNAVAYGAALQQGGYATDPAYAGKLARVAAQIKAGVR